MISPAMSRAAAAVLLAHPELLPADRIKIGQAAKQATDDADFRKRVAGLIDLPEVVT